MEGLFGMGEGWEMWLGGTGENIEHLFVERRPHLEIPRS